MHYNNTDMLTAFLNSADAYRTQMGNSDYTWGNNREKCHASLMFYKLIKYGLNNGNANDSLDYAHAAEGYLHFMHGVNPINMVMLSNMYDYGGDKCANEIYHAWFADGTDFDNAITSLYGPPPGIIPGGLNPYFSPDPSYSGPPLEPPMNQPIQKSYKEWNTGWPENSWEITENSITYQAAYVNMLSKFVQRANAGFSIDIKKGWCGVSSYIDPSEKSLETIFEPFGPDFTILANTTGCYYPAGGIYSIENWDYSEGYIIKVENDLNLTMMGLMANDLQLSLNAGWSLLPVSLACDVPIEALTELLPFLNVIKEVAGTRLYWPAMNITTLTYLQPGKSYWISLRQDLEFTYPACP